MSLTRSSAREKGRRGEREAAAMFGGKRTPLSGAIDGTGDIMPGQLFADSFIVEVKRRAKLPNLLTAALAQAEAGKGKTVGDNRRPLVVYREDNGRWMVSLWADDFFTFCEGLAEIGQGHRLRPYARQLRQIADQIEELSR